MALDTKSNAKRYRIVVKFTLKNVYYFEKKYGVGVERDTVQAHRAGDTTRSKPSRSRIELMINKFHGVIALWWLSVSL